VGAGQTDRDHSQKNLQLATAGRDTNSAMTVTIIISCSRHRDLEAHGQQALALEKAILAAPDLLVVKFVGEGMSPASAMIYDDILACKSKQTQLVGYAYNRLIGADFLPWLRCPKREMVPSGYVYIVGPPGSHKSDGKGGVVLAELNTEERLIMRDYDNALARIGRLLPTGLDVAAISNRVLPASWFAEMGMTGSDCGDAAAPAETMCEGTVNNLKNLKKAKPPTKNDL
jgi:hypothetical protein